LTGDVTAYLINIGEAACGKAASTSGLASDVGRFIKRMDQKPFRAATLASHLRDCDRRCLGKGLGVSARETAAIVWIANRAPPPTHRRPPVPSLILYSSSFSPR
jgi:hypothetical protein